MNKTILVTGGNRGIGAAISRLAAEQGYQVCLTYNSNKASAQKIKEEIEKKGGTVFVYQADVSDEQSVKKLFSKIDAQAGLLYALINNAGIAEHTTVISNYTADRLQRVFSINVFGVFYCCKEAVARMSVKNGGKGGNIVNISSVAAKMGSPKEYIDYAASKAAVDTITIGLAKEVAEDGIRVNCVRPGLTYTDFHGATGDINRPDKLKHTVPLKRIGQPDEIAPAVLWFISEEASYVTGSILDVSGGQ